MDLHPLVSKAVLSLDDDVEVCALLEHLLWPHRVIGVAHAYVALELLAREAFDLFILDVRLPDMDGLQLCRRIRAGDLNAPVVFCSGSASPEDREEAMRAGASAYYDKPVDPGALRGGIEELLAMADERNGIAEAAARERLHDLLRPGASQDVRERGDYPMFRDAVYQRFVAAGGTRAHFARVWPAMLDGTYLGAPLTLTAAARMDPHGR
jgi:CheY-like chemotaxis protein